MRKNALAQQIRAARQMARMRIEDLAIAIGVTRQAVSGWENGHTAPTDDNLAALRRVLGASFGQVADATSSQLQRLHGRSEELEALQRYVLDRQAQLTAALAAATSPYGKGDDDDQPEAPVIPPVPRGPVPDGSRPPVTRARRRWTG